MFSSDAAQANKKLPQETFVVLQKLAKYFLFHRYSQLDFSVDTSASHGKETRTVVSVLCTEIRCKCMVQPQCVL